MSSPSVRATLPSQPQSSGQGTITIEVTHYQLKALSLVANKGQLVVALRNHDDQTKLLAN